MIASISIAARDSRFVSVLSRVTPAESYAALQTDGVRQALTASVVAALGATAVALVTCPICGCPVG